MTENTNDALQTLRQEVERLLGRCLLRLQHYERLVKAMMIDHEISGPADALEAVRATRMADTAGKTLGTMVGKFLGSYVVPKADETSKQPPPDFPEAEISFGSQLQLTDADFARTEKELKEFVRFRNELVHNFIDQHDIDTLAGCRSARDDLIAADSRIKKHLEDLRKWAHGMVDLRRALAAFVQSDTFRNVFIDGIYPDRTVYWPGAGIVRALREASVELATDDWTTVSDAGRWIETKYPDQRPARYECSSWRQVLHESRLFELRYIELGGQRIARYREKVRPANPG